MYVSLSLSLSLYIYIYIYARADFWLHQGPASTPTTNLHGQMWQRVRT